MSRSEVINWTSILTIDGLSGRKLVAARAVALEIALAQGKDPHPVPMTVAELAHRTLFTDRTVRNALDALEEAGYLEKATYAWTPDGRLPNRYSIHPRVRRAEAPVFPGMDAATMRWARRVDTKAATAGMDRQVMITLARIAEGGQAVTTIADLASTLCVSTDTVARSLALLDAQGWIILPAQRKGRAPITLTLTFKATAERPRETPARPVPQHLVDAYETSLAIEDAEAEQAAWEAAEWAALVAAEPAA